MSSVRIEGHAPSVPPLTPADIERMRREEGEWYPCVLSKKDKLVVAFALVVAVAFLVWFGRSHSRVERNPAALHGGVR